MVDAQLRSTERNKVEPQWNYDLIARRQSPNLLGMLHVLQFGNYARKARPGKLDDLLYQPRVDLPEIGKRFGAGQQMDPAIVLYERLFEHGAIEMRRLLGKREQRMFRFAFQQNGEIAAAKQQIKQATIRLHLRQHGGQIRRQQTGARSARWPDD